jgi:Glutathione-dependent formaldehyde-activating enzyme
MSLRQGSLSIDRNAGPALRLPLPGLSALERQRVSCRPDGAARGIHRDGRGAGLSVKGCGRNVTRYFCPSCGSGVFNEIELRPGLVAIKIGTLNELERVSPNYQLFVRSKLPWLSLGDMESFPAMTPPSHQPKP